MRAVGKAFREYEWVALCGGGRGPLVNEAERMGKRKPPVFPEPVCVELMSKKVQCGGYTRHYLSAGEQVAVSSNDRDGILLHRRGSRVACESDVLEQERVERGMCKGGDRVWNTSTGGFNRNFLVLFKVDPSVLLRGVVDITVKLLFKSRVAGANDVFSVTPVTEVTVTPTTRPLCTSGAVPA